MNKEKVKKFAQDFFQSKEEARDFKDNDDVISFYNALNEKQEDFDHEWYIEEITSLQTYDSGSIVASMYTTISPTISKTIILDWEVNTSFESFEDLMLEIEGIEKQAEEIKNLLTPLTLKK